MIESGVHSGSYIAQRVLAALVALPLTAYALLALTALSRGRFDILTAVFFVVPATLAILCWWFALRGHIAESRMRMKYVVTGGFILGGIGFAAGFFGPIVFTPEANQGPLLGIFITGPLGFVLGAALGWLYARIRLGEAKSGAFA